MTFHTGIGEVIFSQEEIDVASKITLERTIFGEDFGFLRSAVNVAVPKITIPSINMTMTSVPPLSRASAAVHGWIPGFER